MLDWSKKQPVVYWQKTFWTPRGRMNQHCAMRAIIKARRVTGTVQITREEDKACLLALTSTMPALYRHHDSDSRNSVMHPTRRGMLSLFGKCCKGPDAESRSTDWDTTAGSSSHCGTSRTLCVHGLQECDQVGKRPTSLRMMDVSSRNGLECTALPSSQRCVPILGLLISAVLPRVRSIVAIDDFAERAAKPKGIVEFAGASHGNTVSRSR